jgi:hypothetical protein
MADTYSVSPKVYETFRDSFMRMATEYLNDPVGAWVHFMLVLKANKSYLHDGLVDLFNQCLEEVKNHERAAVL